MSNQKRKEQKKLKQRDKSKLRVLKRREIVRKQNKEEKEQARISYLYREKQEPYVKKDHPLNNEKKLEQPVFGTFQPAIPPGLVIPKKDDVETIKSRLGEHLEKIKAVEDGILETEKNRDNLNKILEDKGLFDMKSKMEYLQEQTMLSEQTKQKQKQKKGKMKGSAPVSFTPK